MSAGPGEPGTDAAADVVMAYVHSHDVAYSWHASLLDLVMFDLVNGRRLSHRLAVKCGSGGLVEARNQCAAEFLAGPGEWLFVIDTDMGFTPDTLHRLLEVADPTDRPVVGALCFAWLEAERDGLNGYLCGPRPTIFQFREQDGERVFAAVDEYPADTVLPVAATGSACILLHRSALEAVHERFGPTWYDRVPAAGGKLLSEDISLCARLGALEVPVMVHTGVATNHQKTLWVGPALKPPAGAEPAQVVPPNRAERRRRDREASTEARSKLVLPGDIELK